MKIVYIYAHNYLILKLIKYKCPVTDKYKIEKKTLSNLFILNKIYIKAIQIW